VPINFGFSRYGMACSGVFMTEGDRMTPALDYPMSGVCSSCQAFSELSFGKCTDCRGLGEVLEEALGEMDQRARENGL